MKRFLFTISLLFGIVNTGLAQAPVVDTHPNSSIFAIDYATGQEAPATSSAAILFKDALIELVSNTRISKAHVMLAPGKKTFMITQLSPQTNGNAYQLILQARFLGQTNTVYTFVYNVDQNTLSYYNQQNQNYEAVLIEGLNINNLNNCTAYGKFNAENVQPAQPVQQTAAVDADDTKPVDADVQTATVPPAMPDYEQPECPTEGFLWQPGFWAFNASGYYWVPGSWVAPPNPGLLWTPPYWGFVGGVYVFHTGYWGATVGFYGGINYGYGYHGDGFVGGEWRDGHFRYNTAIVRVNENFHYRYEDRAVIYHGPINHYAYNGPGGYERHENARELRAAHEEHVMATREQIRNQQIARADEHQFASKNGGRPASFAVAHVPEKNLAANPGHGPVGKPAGTMAVKTGPGTVPTGTKPSVVNTQQGKVKTPPKVVKPNPKRH